MNLEEVTFGNQVAENEANALSTYFVETQPWKKLFKGEVDIIFGSKGAGKSALYTLLLNKRDSLYERNIFLISAEKPTGKTVFSDMSSEPPTQENEFITLWKVYFCQLIVNWLIENEMCEGAAKVVADKLVEAGLIEEKNTIKRLLASAKNFAKQLTRVEGLEGGLGLEGGVSGKITFHTPDQELKTKGYSSVDDLLDTLNEYLSEIGKVGWILCDRLDVAFDQTVELEKNALRALFKVYRDLEEYESIFLKIFLRDDIWNRITQEGFREASHVNRDITISWNSRNLLNLIVSRALQNTLLLEQYNVDSQEILADYDKQKDFYYKMFPKQVDVGERQSETFEWVLSRIRDGLNSTPPRELIHYYNEMISQEINEQDIANNNVEEPNIISKVAIKNAAFEVSKTRILRTLFAEHPEFKEDILAFENKKAEHNVETLCTVWGVNSNKALTKANKLSEVGFFELKTAKNEKVYKIPFIYRFYLNVTQGKAY
ncbi:hypothetical protein [Pseudoalteromonas sp. MMG005]|uniref:P-loop ATPase, Sll1717 family n=1 Tax=Pseudoalteromonas sp. MMG005 TaxID=2822682 RepID=UPI001B3A4480|nr:hypothetical protein [Pseudoalteromonas sp. MMG005]MBQ4844563.1 hypothetical protein [Pseudoalteromonas sp. MMG005]